MYLPPDAQDRLFDNITALSAPGSRVATEHMDMASLPEDFARLLTERSRRFGSEIDLADLFYDGERHSAGDYLSSLGWTVTVQTTRKRLPPMVFELPEDPLTVGMAVTSGYLICNPEVGDMARTDNDSWDLASSVGSTATMVAAQRVLSNREGLIYDPYAEPLVRAVGPRLLHPGTRRRDPARGRRPAFNMRGRRKEWRFAHAISTRCSPTRPPPEFARP